MNYVVIFNQLQAESANPMTANQIRDAAFASQFESREALYDWLNRAFGKNIQLLRISQQHAQRALRLCPLQGSGYVYLGELCFLNQRDHSASSEYLRQALIVRPHDASVQFAAGSDAWLAGEFERAFSHWQKAFQQDSYYRQQIMNLLSANVPANFIIEKFGLDWESLEVMKRHYRNLNQPDDYSVVLKAHARASIERAGTLQGQKAIDAWFEARKSFDDLNRPEEALRCLHEALRIAPSSFQTRWALGSWLYGQQRYAEAAEHLSWCSRRKPRDQNVKAMAERSIKARLKHASALQARPGNKSNADRY